METKIITNNPENNLVLEFPKVDELPTFTEVTAVKIRPKAKSNTGINPTGSITIFFPAKTNFPKKREVSTAILTIK